MDPGSADRSLLLREHFSDNSICELEKREREEREERGERGERREKRGERATAAASSRDTMYTAAVQNRPWENWECKKRISQLALTLALLCARRRFFLYGNLCVRFCDWNGEREM